jgi:hypothetical protein
VTQPPSPQVLREVADDIRALRIHAIDSPAYRHGAADAIAAVLELIDQAARNASSGASCRFPDCHRGADPETGMCGRHRAVRVTESYLDDRHAEGGHG